MRCHVSTPHHAPGCHPPACPHLLTLAHAPRLAQSFKGSDVLKDVSWEVKKGERVGLVGWNGAGKTTQLKLITGELEPDGGSIIRAKNNMKIAFLSQEFEVVMTRTVRRARVSPYTRFWSSDPAYARWLTWHAARRCARSSCPPSTMRCV